MRERLNHVLTNLFAPGRIGGLTLKNRLVMPAMGSGLGNPDGTPSDRSMAYYERRARGQAGLIIVELTAVHSKGLAGPNSFRLDQDRFVPSFAELAQCVQRHGARIAVQLNHTGRQASPAVIGGEPVCPSPTPATVSGDPPRELSTGEIDELVGSYVAAARRAREAGFDAVELHGAHGYLIWQFLSPLCNRRRDDYGGSTEHRVRFPVRIIRAIKREVGASFPVIIRISGSDFLEGGLDLDQSRSMAGAFEEAGADAVHVSGGSWLAMHWMIQPMFMPRGCLVHLAAGIRSDVRVPVITVGRINDPLLAERILAEGRADLVSMGRPLLADPDLPAKAAAGDMEGIRRCIACNRCIGRRFRGLPLGCTVNPETGEERAFEGEERTAHPRRVVVIGGGPAGLEAATRAQRLGHSVELLEARGRLGGQVNLAGVASYKEELRSVVPYYEGLMKRSGVTVTTGREVRAADLECLEADMVIVATGAVPSMPDIDGLDSAAVTRAVDLLSDPGGVSGRIVIIGGGHVGCETADVCARMGARVTILEMERALPDADPITRNELLNRLRASGVDILEDVRVTGVEAGRVEYADGEGGSGWVDADRVVVAAGSRPRNDLLAALRDRRVPHVAVGDCTGPGDLYQAVHEGANAVRGL